MNEKVNSSPRRSFNFLLNKGTTPFAMNISTEYNLNKLPANFLNDLHKIKADFSQFFNELIVCWVIILNKNMVTNFLIAV